MASQLTLQSAPILRLSSDIWALLTDSLDFGDALRLIATGNRVLSDRVRTRARTLKVCHVSTRYIELDRVFDLLSTFKSLRHVEFREPIHKIRCWTPVAWNLPPQHLTSLSLSFVGAPNIFLQSDLPTSTFPGLINLSLVDDFLSKGLMLSEFAPIDLRVLPPSILRLHIQSTRSLIIDPSHLHSLPSLLESLELDFPPMFRKETATDNFKRVAFPPLPSSVKKLSFQDERYAHWRIDCATLPSSLEILQFKNGYYKPVLGDSGNYESSSFLLEGLATHLPRLVELSLKQLDLSVQDAVRLIPPSVTRLNLTLTGESETDASLIVSRFGHALMTFFPQWEPLAEIILNGKNDLPHLERLQLQSLPPESTCIIPKHVRNLELSRAFAGEIPLSVVHLGIRSSNGSADLNVTPQHKLTSLVLYIPFLKEWLYLLPPTLETLATHFFEDVWSEALRLMTDTDCLPNLRFIDLSDNIALPIDCLIERPLPPQLSRLSISLSPERLDEPPDESHLSNLRSSTHLEELTLRFAQSTPSPAPAFFALLNHLPSKLKLLCVYSDHLPVTWPVVLPTTLKDFETRIIHLSNAGMLLRQWQEDIEKQNSRFTLPPSLTRLCCPKYGSLPNELMKSLPSCLSNVNLGLIFDTKMYFDSRVPPSPSLKLDFRN